MNLSPRQSASCATFSPLFPLTLTDTNLLRLLSSQHHSGRMNEHDRLSHPQGKTCTPSAKSSSPTQTFSASPPSSMCSTTPQSEMRRRAASWDHSSRMTQQTISSIRIFSPCPLQRYLCLPCPVTSTVPRTPSRRVDRVGRERVIYVLRSSCAHLERRVHSGRGHRDVGDGRQE